MGHVVGIAITLVIFFIQHELVPLVHLAPFILFFLAVFLASWIGGRGPGFSAMSLAAVLADYHFLPPFHRWSLDPESLVLVGLFLLISTVVNLLGSRLRDALEEVDSHLAALKEASEAKELFFNTLSHELRTPLTAILNAMEILRRPESTTAHATRAHEIIARNITQQVRLVDDLLDLSRITRGKVEIQREVLDLREILKEQAEAFGAAARDKGLELATRTGGAPLLVLGDRLRLGQILANLLTNAIKYTEAGGSITATVAAEGTDAVLLRIRDTGVGISRDLLPHIFEPFRQAETSLARTSGGLGIGLSIARSLSERHGGTLTAHSDGIGAGSVLTLRLPRAEARPRRPERAEPTGRPRRVLVVEDNLDVRDSTVLLLETLGHGVSSTSSGGEALAIAERDRPEVALIDIGLPDLDGHEVARRLRARFPNGALRLVALTGYSDKVQRQAADAAGFDDYLVKPASRADLVRVLR
jgi:two-component system, sensor histidine kinase